LQSLENCHSLHSATRIQTPLVRANRVYPGVELTTDYSELLDFDAIDAIAVVTPVWTHFELAKAALQNASTYLSKTVHLDAATSRGGSSSWRIARDSRSWWITRFLFSGAVRKIRQLVDDGTLGDLYYFDSTRVNLGLFQHDVNVVWDLAPTICPSWITSSGRSRKPWLQRAGSIERPGDVAFITVYFPHDVDRAHQRELLSPVKVRKTPDRRREENAGVERPRS